MSPPTSRASGRRGPAADSRSVLIETLLRDAAKGLTRAEIKKSLTEDHAELVASLPKTGDESVDGALEVRRMSN